MRSGINHPCFITTFKPCQFPLNPKRYYSSSQDIPNQEKKKLENVPTLEQFYKIVQDFKSAGSHAEEQLVKKKYNLGRIKMVILVLLIIFSASIYNLLRYTYDLFIPWAGKQLNLVTSTSLKDQELHKELQRFFKELMESEELQQLVEDFCQKTIERLSKNKFVQNDIGQLLYVIVLDLLNNPTIQKELQDLFTRILESQEFKTIEADNIQQVLHSLISDKEYETIRIAFFAFLTQELNKILVDPDVHRNAATMVTGTLGGMFFKR